MTALPASRIGVLGVGMGGGTPLSQPEVQEPGEYRVQPGTGTRTRRVPYFSVEAERDSSTALRRRMDWAMARAVADRRFAHRFLAHPALTLWAAGCPSDRLSGLAQHHPRDLQHLAATLEMVIQG